MLEKGILALSLAVVVAIAIRILRRTRGISLLAWHVLFLVLALEPGTFLLETINSTSELSIAATDRAIVGRMTWALVLVNLVAIIFLVSLWDKRIRRQSLRTADSGSVRRLPVYTIGYAIVLAGFLLFLLSPRVQLVLQRGLEGFGDYSAYYRLRYEIGRIAIPIVDQYIQVLSLITILPLLTLYSLYRFFKTRNRRWLFRWFGLASIWAIVALLSYAKWPILSMILSNLLVPLLSATAKPGMMLRRKWKTLAKMSLCLFFAVYGVYRLLGATSDLSTSSFLLWQRTVVVPVLTTYNHFVVFPDKHAHTYYQTSRILNLVLAGRTKVAGGEQPPYLIASEILTGMPFNMNTSLVGAGWAEMGYLGVVECAFLVFGMLAFWDHYFLRKRSYASLTVLAAYFVGRGDNIPNVDLFGMLITGGAVLAPIFILMFHVTGKRAVNPCVQNEGSGPALLPSSVPDPVRGPSIS